MSLQTRLSALATAIGADIKSLRTDLNTFLPVTAKAFTLSLSAAQNLGGGNPVNWTAEVVDTDNLRNANLTSVVLPAGIWWVDAVLRPDQAMASGAFIQAFIQVNGVSRSEGIGVQQAGATSPSCVIPGIPVVSDGTTSVRVIVYTSNTGSTVAVTGGYMSGVIAGGARGPQGPKGDSGDTSQQYAENKLGAPSVGTAIVANNWTRLPMFAAADLNISKVDGVNDDFIRNSDGTLTNVKAGYYDVNVSAGFPGGIPGNGQYNIGWGFRSDGAVPTANDLVGYTSEQIAHSFPVLAYSKGAYLPAGSRLAGFIWSALVSSSCGLYSFSIGRTGGVKGEKGDPGDVSLITTLNWNTALAPGFYRSVYDELGMQQTINGPGDTLNPPPQAGIVAAHQNGRVVQRVWDLDTQIAWTRHKIFGGSWTAWAADLSKPPLWAEILIGGSAPKDGDERYFQSAAMKALGILWKFRYNAGSSSTYKWEFAGGQPMVNSMVAQVDYSSTSYTPTSPIQVTAPLPGEYAVTVEGQGYNNTAGGSGYLSYAQVSAVASNDGNATVFSTQNGNGESGSRTSKATVLSEGRVFDLQGRVTVAGHVARMYYRSLAILPIRVGM